MAYAAAVTHADSADGTFSPSGATAWNAAHTVAYTDVVSGGVLYGTSTTGVDFSALLAANAVVLGGGAGAAPLTSSKLSESATAGGGLIVTGGTAVTDVAAFSLTRTNNNAAVATGVLWTFTDTSSAVGFKPFQILGGAGGATNLFNVDKSGQSTGISIEMTSASASFIGSGGGYIRTGNIYLNDVANQADIYSNAGAFCIGATIDAFLNRPAANVLGSGTAVNNTLGSFRGKYQSSDATVGVSGTGTNITCKDGIITSIA